MGNYSTAVLANQPYKAAVLSTDCCIYISDDRILNLTMGDANDSSVALDVIIP